MNIHLLRTKDVTIELFNNVLNLLLSASGPMDFKPYPPLKKFKEQVVSWSDLFSTCHHFRQSTNLPDDDFVILLTTTANTENWFSACDPEGSNSVFIHAGEWENYLDCSVEYPLAYEIVENVLECLMFADFNELVQAAHEPAIGCITDMCSWKSDILFKLRTADICHDCLRRLDANGVHPDLVRQAINIIENIRPNVLFSNSLRERRENDEAFPFPVGITRRKMKQASQPLHKFLCLIDHFDSLIRTSVIIIGNMILGASFAQFYREQELSARPSLGHWVAALTQLTKLNANANHQRFNLPDDTLHRIKRIIEIAQQEKIVHLRNERKGHGYQECYEEAYQRDFEENIGKLGEIEKILKPIFLRCPLFYINQSDHHDEMSFSIHVKKLMGSHPDFLEEDIVIKVQSIQELPVSRNVYVNNLQCGQWHNLSPYFLYGECPSCSQPRVLISDGADVYLDPYMGHRVTIR